MNNLQNSNTELGMKMIQNKRNDMEEFATNWNSVHPAQTAHEYNPIYAERVAQAKKRLAVAIVTLAMIATLTVLAIASSVQTTIAQDEVVEELAPAYEWSGKGSQGSNALPQFNFMQ